MQGIVECVPNISEGRDSAKIQRIIDAASSVDGCAVLGVEPDADYNRTVITLAGNPDAVSQAAFCLVKSALIEIDMREHTGEHPRLGAVDVCPFIPLQGVTMEDCSNLAKELAKRVAKECLVPTFLYGEAALVEQKTLLSTIRKGQYEGLEDRLTGGDSTHTDETRDRKSVV